MNLKKYICGTTNKIPRGAVSRVAEFLQQSREVSIAAIMGIYRTKEIEARAQEFVSSNANFSTKKMGHPVAEFDTREVLALRAQGKSFQTIGEALNISGETARKVVVGHERKMKIAASKITQTGHNSTVYVQSQNKLKKVVAKNP